MTKLPSRCVPDGRRHHLLAAARDRAAAIGCGVVKVSTLRQVPAESLRTTGPLKAAPLAGAEQLCGDLERGALLKQALRALVQRVSAERLTTLSGSDPTLGPMSRRRSAARLRLAPPYGLSICAPGRVPQGCPCRPRPATTGCPQP
jgi:hypothetical protein